MSVEAEKIIEQALHLSPIERAAVVEGIISSLDKPDPTLDELWAKEAECRIDSAERGEMDVVSSEDVFAKYEQR